MGILDTFAARTTTIQELPDPNAVKPFPQIMRDNIAEEYAIKNRAGIQYVSDYTPVNGGILDRFNHAQSPVSTVQEPNTFIDYIYDSGVETIAGVIEGATLENLDLGEIGPDTAIGDIARSVGKFGGSIIPYAGIAALLGNFGIFAGAVSLPAVAGRSGATAFTGRFFTDVLNQDEDMLDRVQSSLLSGTIGTAIGSIPFALDKAIYKFSGGPVQYMERLKTRLSNHLVNKFGFSPEDAEKAGTEFVQKVQQHGGAKAYHATALKRVAKGQEVLAKQWAPMNRRIHAIARDTGLIKGNDPSAYYEKNISVIGKAHTNEMSLNELKTLNKFYTGHANRYGKIKSTKDLKFTDDMKEVIGGKIGQGARFRPVERVMTENGLGKEFEIAYNADNIMNMERADHFKVLRSLTKGMAKTQNRSVFILKDNVDIPLNATDAQIFAIYTKAAGRFGVNTQGVKLATWMRQTERGLLKRMNSVLVGEGKDPVKELPAYITHLLRDTSNRQGGLSVDAYNAVKNTKPTAISRFLSERLGGGELVEDAVKTHSAYVRSALRMINMRPAMRQINNNIGKKTVLENGQRVVKVFDKELLQYKDDWFKHGLMNLPTNLDIRLDRTLGFSNRRAVAAIKMAGYRGTLWGRPASVIKNMTQQTLNIAKLGPRFWSQGMASFNPHKEFMNGLNGWKFAEKHSKLLQGRQPMLEGMEPDVMGWFTKMGFAPFRLVDKANIVAGFNGGVRKFMADGKSFGDAVNLADKLVRNTQFNYSNIDLPLSFMSGPGRLTSQFQSWWTRYLEEVWSWGGKMPYGDGTSRVLNIAKNSWNIAKSKEFARYTMINMGLLGALYTTGASTGIITKAVPVPFISPGPLPRGLPPAMQGILSMGLTSYATMIGDDRMYKHWSVELGKQIGLHTIPGFITINQLARIKQGKQAPSTLFFPQTKTEYDKWAGR